MIPVPLGVRVWLPVGHTDLRRGMNSLALQIQEKLGRDQHAGDLYVFRGKRGQLIKILGHDGMGMSPYAKRLERGRSLWPAPADGTLAISSAQLAHMLKGIDGEPGGTCRPQATSVMPIGQAGERDNPRGSTRIERGSLMRTHSTDTIMASGLAPHATGRTHECT